MNIIGEKIQIRNLLKIKQIVDRDTNGDKFILVRTKKNKEFMEKYGLGFEDIKDIVRQLSIDDCFSGPEADRDAKYNGWIFKFCPMFENIKLYVKIRVDEAEKAICISVHEFGKYDGGK